MLKSYPRYAVQPGYISQPYPLSAHNRRHLHHEAQIPTNEHRSRSCSRSRSPTPHRVSIWKHLFKSSSSKSKRKSTTAVSVPSSPTFRHDPRPKRSSLRNRNSQAAAPKRVTFHGKDEILW
ncbi:hypothetical protein NEOLEDRAFT_1181900 [Neolentinus lepideus HHB14362 ss-1]|uniref:Uncharacterized protein n=1 Tax=Neolentinus lepideus HHB14362 ss-1 TaxID=1314782 RepID=A0A165PJH6_9AGAM|nr:hypothetical protein NEOLEDRAFT_1181900 [Neolentinus lepideus HHB14362 ss-1]